VEESSPYGRGVVSNKHQQTHRPHLYPSRSATSNNLICTYVTAQLLIHGISPGLCTGEELFKFELTKKFWSESHKLAAEGTAERVGFLPYDLSDVTVVKKVGDSLMEKLDRLDMLIDSAGQQSFMKTWRQPITIRRSSNRCPLHTFSPRHRDNLGN
jgi:hypothetical protein